MYYLYGVVSLIDWPDVTLDTNTFLVEIKACSLTYAQWTDSSSMTLNTDYILDGPQNLIELTFELDVMCAFQTKVLMSDDLHDLSIITKINSVGKSALDIVPNG